MNKPMKTILIAIGCLFAYNLYADPIPICNRLEVGPATADTLTFHYTAPPNCEETITGVTLDFTDFDPEASTCQVMFGPLNLTACQTADLVVPMGYGEGGRCERPIHCGTLYR